MNRLKIVNDWSFPGSSTVTPIFFFIPNIEFWRSLFYLKIYSRISTKTLFPSLIPNDEATCVVTPLGTELNDCKAINVTEEHEWVAHPKTPAITENATTEQINQNPYARPPKRRWIFFLPISNFPFKLFLIFFHFLVENDPSTTYSTIGHSTSSNHR